MNNPALPMPATTAFATAWGQARAQAVRTVSFVALLCLGIAVLTTALDGRSFFTKLLYSCCIGACCTALIEVTRLGLAATLDQLRRLRGLEPSHCGFDSGWRGMLLAGPVAALLGPVLGLALADSITGHRSPSLLSLGQTSSRMTLVLALLGTGISMFVLGTMERLAQARARAEAAQRAAAENQLRLLQSQLEPHMLFNTLANLRVLIGLDPVRAQAMLDRLINFLRATLSASRRSSQALADEFRHLDDYLALMAIRMGPRLAVQLDLPDELSALAVPPLLLQPLVENAIKHGLEPKVEGGRIEVSARRTAERLVLSVRDTGIGLQALPAASGSGFGLEQVRTRLATLHGDRASLTLQPAPDSEGGVLATLQLPLPPP
jgi:signal transduction histidine kinase